MNGAVFCSVLIRQRTVSSEITSFLITKFCCSSVVTLFFLPVSVAWFMIKLLASLSRSFVTLETACSLLPLFHPFSTITAGITYQKEIWIMLLLLRGLSWWLSSKESPGNVGDTEDTVSIPELGRSPVGGNGSPLQYSCLKRHMDRGTWQAIIQRVSKSCTWLSTQDNIFLFKSFSDSHHIAHESELDLNFQQSNLECNTSKETGPNTESSAIYFSRQGRIL